MLILDPVSPGRDKGSGSNEEEADRALNQFLFVATFVHFCGIGYANLSKPIFSEPDKGSGSDEEEGGHALNQRSFRRRLHTLSRGTFC